MNLNQLFESLSADQRHAGQLPADFRAPNTSPQLSGPYPGRNATRGYLVGESVRVVDQDYDLDQIILTLDINGRPVSFTYTDYDEDFDNAERGDVHNQLQRNDWYASLSHPDRMEILDAAYRAIRGEEPGEYRPTVDDEPMDVGDRLDEKGVAEGSDDIEDTRQWRDAIALAKSQKAIRQARYGKDQKFYADGTPVTPEEVARRAAERKAKKKGVAEGHADQQKTIVKRNGQPVGEVGIDRESSPGGGMYYMKHYASGLDLGGYDSREEAMDELRYAVKQGVSEAMKPSDIPPSMRQRLTMRDIEAERPQGAYRFRVTFPDGATADFMDFEAAQERAAADRGRISRLSEEKKKSNARIERILRQLRARHPQAEDDLEALIYDFRSQQAQDRTDIARLDRENDMEEADIERLEQMLDVIRRRRGVEPVAEPVQEDGMDSVTEYKIKKKSDQDQDNFTADDIKTLETIADLETLKARAKQLIKGKPARRMKPEKIAYFYDKIDDMPSRLQIIKLMYDLLLSGEGNQVIGTKWSTNPNTYRRRFGESLRPGEYHIATVTLDDGTTKKVRITTDEGFRDQIKQHFQKQGRTVTDIDVDYAVRSELGEEKPRFVGVPARPQPAPTGATKTLPPAPGRPGMVGGPRDQQRDVERDLARRMAAEDVLGDVKRRLGDVLKQREQQRAARMPVKQMPQDVLGDPVKRIDLGDGNILMIHGNEDDGFRIHLGQRVMPTRFATMEQAEIATRMFEAKRDACYNKVKSRYKVWPSAYASGALVQCRKQGAANWGTKKK